jgi:hypothetical protein
MLKLDLIKFFEATLDLLSQQTEMRIMDQQPHHDQVCIKPIQAMPDIWTIIRLHPRQPNVLHDLVFALPRKHNLYVPPVQVLCDLLVEKIPHLCG